MFLENQTFSVTNVGLKSATKRGYICYKNSFWKEYPMELQSENTNAESVLTFDGGNIPLMLAAKIMKKDYQSVRIGIIKGYLPIGTAYRMEHSKKYTFYISPKKFYEYTGCVVTDEMIQEYKDSK